MDQGEQIQKDEALHEKSWFAQDKTKAGRRQNSEKKTKGNRIKNPLQNKLTQKESSKERPS